jgi:hypothetical protein
MRQYDYINRHICNNIDRIEDETAKAQLKALCKQCFCDHEQQRLPHLKWQQMWENGVPSTCMNTIQFRSSTQRAKSALCQRLDASCSTIGAPELSQRTRPLSIAQLGMRCLTIIVITAVVLLAAYALLKLGSDAMSSKRKMNIQIADEVTGRLASIETSLMSSTSTGTNQ